MVWARLELLQYSDVWCVRSSDLAWITQTWHSFPVHAGHQDNLDREPLNLAPQAGSRSCWIYMNIGLAH